jgi:hypothetical protein
MPEVDVKVVVLRVMMHCEGCASTVKRAVKRIPGDKKLSTSTKFLWFMASLLFSALWRNLLTVFGGHLTHMNIPRRDLMPTP